MFCPGPPQTTRNSIAPPLKKTDLLPQTIDKVNNKFQTVWGKLLFGIAIFKTLLFTLE
jgi:hypothetical protein